jgi:hypothetical protein
MKQNLNDLRRPPEKTAAESFTILGRSLRDEVYVVSFSHIDDDRCLRPLVEDVTGPFSEPGAEEYRKEKDLRAELHLLFRAHGWEGDGEIKCMFLAPCFLDRWDGWCETVYHVKQSNNGTSWLAIPKGMKLSLPEKQE